jgi:hypothetical protein
VSKDRHSVSPNPRRRDGVTRHDLGQMTDPRLSSLQVVGQSALRQIKAQSGGVCDSCVAFIHPRRRTMPVNVGTIDQYVRIVVGLALVAYALQDGLSIQGWHWAGLIGLVLLVTAFFKSCPLYTVLGFSSRSARQ